MGQELDISFSVVGVVEAFIDSVVYGWTQSGAIVSVVSKGIVIGQGVATIDRVDLAKGKHPARGFKIVVSGDFSVSDIVGGEVVVYGALGKNSVVIPTWSSLEQIALFSKLNYKGVADCWSSLPFDKKISAKTGLSKIFGGMGVGRLSEDKNVQLGRNGHLFLSGGSNNLSRLYTGDVKIDIESWILQFNSRNSALKNIGCDYFQIILPEKSSVLADFAPFKASAGSYPYMELIRGLESSPVKYFDFLNCALSSSDRAKLFPLNDTHLSTDGAELFWQYFLSALGFSVDYQVKSIEFTLVAGDLGRRFECEGDIKELVKRYSGLVFDGEELIPVLVDKYDPDNGHAGIRRVFVNERAPIRKKVVCFGNSFFERGASSGTLSWWASRFFREFHFVWCPDFDFDYVEKISPDIVFGQTIERFLTALPKK